MKIMFSIYFVLLYFRKPAKVTVTQGHIATTLVSVNEAGDDAIEKRAAAMEDDLQKRKMIAILGVIAAAQRMM